MREAHKRSRNPKVRKTYRVKNWSDYDTSLRARGDITFWFSDEVIGAWSPKQNGRRSHASVTVKQRCFSIRLFLPIMRPDGLNEEGT